MDQELIAYLEERFRESSRQMQSFREETISRFEQVDDAVRQNKDEIRHTQILVEAVRSDLQGVAEGVIGANERIDVLREEMKQEVGKVGGLVDLSHKAHKDVNRRVRSLEEWRKRVNEDPTPRLRKNSGKKS